MNKFKKILAGTLAGLTVFIASGCSTDADVVSKNLSTEADQFNLNRRVIFVNGITDKYLMTIEGKCSIKDADGQLEVTCMTGPNEYKKHFLRLSDNVTYFVEQLDGANVSRYHYVVIFKPEAIVPDIQRP